MKKARLILTVAALVSALSICACKNHKSGQQITPTVQPGNNTGTQATPQVKDLDVAGFATLFCKTADMDKALPRLLRACLQAPSALPQLHVWTLT